MKRGDVGSVFFYYEDYGGSGEKDCWQLYQVSAPRYKVSPYVTPVAWLGHTCAKPIPNKTVAKLIDHFEKKGRILWVVP